MSNLPNHLQAFKRAIFIAILAAAIPMAPMLIVGGIVGSASAQIVDIPAILAADMKGPPNFVTVQYGHQFKTDVEDGGADMSRDNAFFMGGAPIRAQRRDVHDRNRRLYAPRIQFQGK
jgi:hypothetical protein